VPKMTDAGENHCHLAFIGSCDHLFVAHGSARLNGAGRTGISGGDKAVRKWEKRVAVNSATLEGEPSFLCLPDGNSRRINPRHLACSNSKGAVRRRVNDRI